MKITAIVENVSKSDTLLSQYGLSLFVETESGNIVVDAGQDNLSLDNFYTLGLNPTSINALVISHNHFDHIGGLQYYIDATSDNEIPVYISANISSIIISKRFLRRRVVVSRNELVENNQKRMQFVKNSLQILPNVYACVVQEADATFLCKDKKLRMIDGKGRMIPDDFRHEIYVAVIEDDSIKIISPCSHMGIINIISDAQKRFGLPVKCFVGGLHLRGESSNSLNCSKDYIFMLADKLNETQLENLYTCHCTGFKAYSMLKQRLNDLLKFKYFHTGQSFEI